MNMFLHFFIDMCASAALLIRSKQPVDAAPCAGLPQGRALSASQHLGLTPFSCKQRGLRKCFERGEDRLGSMRIVGANGGSRIFGLMRSALPPRHRFGYAFPAAGVVQW